MPKESRQPGVTAAPFYDAVAATYDRLMATSEAGRMRRRFLRSVVSRVPRPGPLLDFGCGTGVDARSYACLGYEVVAYDPSDAMLAVLRRRCVGAIRTGMVRPVSGDFEACLAAARPLLPLGCIAANFAVLNHIDEPEPLLGRLAELLGPRGLICLSVLNPWYWRDVRQSWWWRARWRSMGRKALVVDLGETRTVRHSPARIGREAGLHQVERRGALHGGWRDHLPGHAADPLVHVVLSRP